MSVIHAFKVINKRLQNASDRFNYFFIRMGRKKFSIHVAQERANRGRTLRGRFPGLLRKLMEIGLCTDTDVYFELYDRVNNILWVVYTGDIPTADMEEYRSIHITYADAKKVYVEVTEENYKALATTTHFTVRYMQGHLTPNKLQLRVIEQRLYRPLQNNQHNILPSLGEVSSKLLQENE